MSYVSRETHIRDNAIATKLFSWLAIKWHFPHKQATLISMSQFYKIEVNEKLENVACWEHKKMKPLQ